MPTDIIDKKTNNCGQSHGTYITLLHSNTTLIQNMFKRPTLYMSKIKVFVISMGTRNTKSFPIQLFALWHNNQFDYFQFNYEFCTLLLLTIYAIMLANECYNNNNNIMINLYDMDSFLDMSFIF